MSQRNRNYLGEMWEIPLETEPSVEEAGARAERRKLDFAKAKEEQEGRVFEDPFYLQQYNINWDDNVEMKNENVENGAFLTALNEFYLDQVITRTNAVEV